MAIIACKAGFFMLVGNMSQKYILYNYKSCFSLLTELNAYIRNKYLIDLNV